MSWNHTQCPSSNTNNVASESIDWSQFGLNFLMIILNFIVTVFILLFKLTTKSDWILDYFRPEHKRTSTRAKILRLEGDVRKLSNLLTEHYTPRDKEGSWIHQRSSPLLEQPSSPPSEANYSSVHTRIEEEPDPQ